MGSVLTADPPIASPPINFCTNDPTSVGDHVHVVISR